MSLSRDQGLFAKKIALLILYADSIGYYVTFGDAYATDGHSDNSFHYKRLAIDLNLFSKSTGEFLPSTEAHRPLGKVWMSMGGTWGGTFANPDGNHYSWGEN